MKTPRRILIIQTAYLGDVIITTGILEKLHQFFPSAKIDFLIKKGYSSLFDQHPFLHQVLTFDKSKKIGEIRRLRKTIQNQLYDIVVNAHRYLSTGIITVGSRAAYKIGYAKNPMSIFYDVSIPDTYRDSRYEHERLHDLIVGITDETPHLPKLYVDDHKPDITLSKPYVCIAPMSIWFTKIYPKERWVEFINKIPSATHVYLVGAPAEKPILEDIKDAVQHNRVINTAGQVTMLESIHIMKHAIMNYTSDSAPLHMASAINAPVVALFLSTTPEYGFGAISEDSHIIQSDHSLTCRPCGVHGHKACPKGHFKCSEIDVRLLLDLLPENN